MMHCMMPMLRNHTHVVVCNCFGCHCLSCELSEWSLHCLAGVNNELSRPTGVLLPMGISCAVVSLTWLMRKTRRNLVPCVPANQVTAPARPSPRHA
jgi:hypothetical protein